MTLLTVLSLVCCLMICSTHGIHVLVRRWVERPVDVGQLGNEERYSLQDTLGANLDLTYSDYKKMLTSVKDVTLGACFITDLDPGFTLSSEEKMELFHTQKTTRIHSEDDLYDLLTRVGPDLTTMCRDLDIIWLTSETDPGFPPPSNIQPRFPEVPKSSENARSHNQVHVQPTIRPMIIPTAAPQRRPDAKRPNQNVFPTPVREIYKMPPRHQVAGSKLTPHESPMAVPPEIASAHSPPRSDPAIPPRKPDTRIPPRINVSMVAPPTTLSIRSNPVPKIVLTPPPVRQYLAGMSLPTRHPLPWKLATPILQKLRLPVWDILAPPRKKQMAPPIVRD